MERNDYVSCFEDVELARLLAAQDAVERLTDEDAVLGLPKTPTSRAGDLWVIGDPTLLGGTLFWLTAWVRP